MIKLDTEKCGLVGVYAPYTFQNMTSADDFIRVITREDLSAFEKESKLIKAAWLPLPQKTSGLALGFLQPTAREPAEKC